MKIEYIEFYLSVTDVRKLPPDNWYKVPKDPMKKEFLEWYEKETMCIEFSANKSHFRILFYPTKATKQSYLSPVGYTAPVVKIKEVVHDSRAIKTEGNSIPGFCSRSDIVEKILNEEKLKISKKSDKIRRELEFMEQKRKFLGLEEEDDI